MNKSILKVTEARWRQAQQFELHVWRQQSRWYRILMSRVLKLLHLKDFEFGDDWNRWWYEQFDGYKVVPRDIDQAVELGCGPYTNMRLVLENRTIRKVICSDPLAEQYLKMNGWLSSAYRKQLIEVDSNPAEECPYENESCDLVLLINVLDHVQDAIVVLDNVFRILKPGAFFVFGQDLTDEIDMNNTEEDVGHPIRIHHDELDRWIADNFDVKMRKVLSREVGRNPEAHYGTFLFIGQKR
ncbi:MAG: methyltransferase domain-containing protein [Chloroflexota bacterium]